MFVDAVDGVNFIAPEVFFFKFLNSVLVPILGDVNQSTT